MLLKKTLVFHLMLMLVFVSLLIATSVKAQVPVYQLKHEEQLIEHYLYRLTEPAGSEQVVNITNLASDHWQPTQLANGDLLIMPGENWFVFKLENSSEQTKHAYVVIANQVRIKHSKLYVLDKVQKRQAKPMVLQRSNNRSAQVTVPPLSEVTIYLTIESATQLRSTAVVYSTAEYVEANGKLQFQQGITIGGLLCLSIAFILLFFAIRNLSILTLCGYLISNTLLLAAMLGINLYYFFPHLPTLAGIELPLLIASSAIFLLMFTTQLFNLKEKFPKNYQVIRMTCWGLLLYMPLSMKLSVVDNISISMAINVLVIFSLMMLSLYLYGLRLRLALLFTLVMAVQLILILVAIVSVNWLDIGFVAHRNLFYGITFWLNGLLITLILSRQYRYQLAVKHEAQQQALDSAIASERSQEALLKLQTQSQEELEERVQARTLELNIALQELGEANRELEQKNTLDELTGLFNRRFYDQKIVAEYRRSKRNLTPLSLVLIDVDHFKAVNDTYGHLAGDQCLVWLSHLIQKSLKRSTDMAFRYGGEEFCLILPDTDSQGAITLAEVLRKAVAKQGFNYKEVHIKLTISNGIYTYQQQDGVTPEQIFAAADKALYQAKGDGRNQTQVFEHNLD